eukprot:9182170-Pyramimonas_sp.AAC.1
MEDTQQASLEMMNVVTKRCSAGLGICPDDLEFYEIRPLAPEEASLAMARGSHIGVRVKGSVTTFLNPHTSSRAGFTLAAVESLLEEQAKLVENLDQILGRVQIMEIDSHVDMWGTGIKTCRGSRRIAHNTSRVGTDTIGG